MVLGEEKKDLRSGSGAGLGLGISPLWGCWRWVMPLYGPRQDEDVPSPVSFFCLKPAWLVGVGVGTSSRPSGGTWTTIQRGQGYSVVGRRKSGREEFSSKFMTKNLLGTFPPTRTRADAPPHPTPPPLNKAPHGLGGL